MRVFFKTREKGGIEFGLIYGSMAFLALAAARFDHVAAMAPSCAWKGLFGVPCPACGATRALIHLAHGEFTRALAMNPVVALAVMFAVVFFFYSLITLMFGLRRIGFIMTEGENKSVRIAAWSVLFLQWGWLIRTL